MLGAGRAAFEEAVRYSQERIRAENLSVSIRPSPR